MLANYILLGVGVLFLIFAIARLSRDQGKLPTPFLLSPRPLCDDPLVEARVLRRLAGRA